MGTSARRWLVIAAVATLIAGLSVALPPRALAETPTSGHPRLLFGREDVPALQARVSSGTPAQAWAVLRQKVDAWSDPANPGYIDPNLVADPTNPSNQGWRYFDGILGQNQMGSILTDLGFAYVISGDARYGRHAAEILLRLAVAGWPHWNNNQLGSGDLLKGVGLAFDWTYDVMTAEERGAIVGSLTAHEARVFSCLYSSWYPVSAPGYNWQTVCGGGNGLTMLALDGEPGAPADLADRLTVATQRITQTFPVQIGQNGDGSEGLNYLFYGLHNALPFVFAYERATGIDLLTHSPGIKNVARHLAFEQQPGQGESFLPRNDSPEYLPGVQEIAPMLFNVDGDDTAGWLWDNTVGPAGDDIFNPVTHPAYVSHGVTGSPQCLPPEALVASPINAAFCWNSAEVYTILYWQSPAELPRVNPGSTGPRSQLHPEYGLVDFRTGWGGAGEVAGSFEAKHDHKAGHSHEDIGQFTLYGHGTAFAMGSGYGHNYSCSSTTAIYEGGCPTTDVGHALGHNVVIIDGNRYTQNGNGVFTRHNSIPTYLDDVNGTVIRSDLRAAYAPTSLSSIPDAGRDLLFSRAPGEPVLLAVTDHIKRDGGTHGFEWRLHVDATNPLTLTGPNSYLMATASGATMTGAVAQSDGTPLLLSVKPWAQPVGARIEHAFLSSATVTNQARFDHLSVSAVNAPGQVPATVASQPALGGSVISVGWTGGEAVFGARAWPSATLTSARLVTDGELAKVAPQTGHTVLVNGTSLTLDGTSYASVAGGPGTVTLSGSAASAQGPAGAVYRVRAPAGLTAATVNGAPVDWVQDGTDVVFPRPTFGLALGATQVSTAKNTTTSTALTVSSVNRFSSPVALSMQGLPSGVAATLSPTSVATPPAGGAAAVTLTLLPGPFVRPGSYRYTVSASGGGVTKTASGTLVVLESP